MRKSPLTILPLLLLLELCPITQAESIYRWVDKDGKVHFSDRISKSADSAKFENASLPIIKTIKSKAKPIFKQSKQKNKVIKKSSSESKTSRCNKINSDINSIERKLRTRLQADKSDQHSKILAELRWQKIKSC